MSHNMNQAIEVSSPKLRRLRLVVPFIIVLLLAFMSSPAAGGGYQQVNLVSDLPGVAMLQDTNLVNAWGMSFSPASPFWISDNGTGKSTLYSVTNGAVSKVALEVVIPGEGNPTGQVFNRSTAFNGDL